MQVGYCILCMAATLSIMTVNHPCQIQCVVHAVLIGTSQSTSSFGPCTAWCIGAFPRG